MRLFGYKRLGTQILCRYQHTIANLLSSKIKKNENHTIQGWVSSVRKHKDVVFVHLNDGSCLTNLQVVAQPNDFPSTVNFGSCVKVEGLLKDSSHAQQPVELVADNITVVGPCDTLTYPFKYKKHHPPDYERKYLHLRPRTPLFSSILRARNAATHAMHNFFQKDGYVQIHTPILTSNDCEGAGEVFLVEPADKSIMQEISEDKDHAQEHFFDVPAYLSVSGQLHLEIAAGSFSKVYTFGPTFRAENSRGRHHLSEFYMVEAELAHITEQEDLCEVMEGLVQSVTRTMLDTMADDLQYVWKNNTKQPPVMKWVDQTFIRMTYTDAIDILMKSKEPFNFPVKWGCDLQKDQERYIVKHCGQVPVFVTDFPASLKPFYARKNNDENTVAAVDLLAPGVGELCGGSLREERLDVLSSSIYQQLAPAAADSLDWYMDLRRFGSTPHGGFGLGFERYLQTLLGVWNIKDTIPFPRSTHKCKM